MTDTAKYLETFPAWLRSLGEDAEAMAGLLADDRIPGSAREVIAGGLNYLFKSLDLIPDGIDDIGYLDDAFVLRIAADLARKDQSGKIEPDKLRRLNELADEVGVVREFLEKDFPRLEGYVKGLRRGAARGRAVSDIVGNDTVRSDFLSDVRGFMNNYEAPGFAREEKNLIKLRAFFDAKLPK